MVEGDKYQLVVPSELGYGSKGVPPSIPAGAVLCFKMELLQINGTKVDAGRSGQMEVTCNVRSFDGCIQREIDYIKSMQRKLSVRPWPKGESPREKLEAERERLAGIRANGQMKKELKVWNARRSDLLTKMLEYHMESRKEKYKARGFDHPKDLEWHDPPEQSDGHTEL